MKNELNGVQMVAGVMGKGVNTSYTLIRILDRQKLSVRKVAEKTGFDYADFSRIRNADLRRFTIDRLVAVLKG